MNDELKECTCGRSHPWGIIRYSEDDTPLYGPRPISTCNNFRPKLEVVPAGVDAKALWAETGDLNAQASLATRLVVSKIRALGDGQNAYAKMAQQWPEFLGFVVSQITDMRGSLVRDETKFAHLVAHTDEIVETMRNVTQLTERLKIHGDMLGDIMDRLSELQEDRRAKHSADVEAWEHFGLLPANSAHDMASKRWHLSAGNPQDVVLVDSELGDDEGKDDPSKVLD